MYGCRRRHLKKREQTHYSLHAERSSSNLVCHIIRLRFSSRNIADRHNWSSSIPDGKSAFPTPCVRGAGSHAAFDRQRHGRCVCVCVCLLHLVIMHTRDTALPTRRYIVRQHAHQHRKHDAMPNRMQAAAAPWQCAPLQSAVQESLVSRWGLGPSQATPPSCRSCRHMAFVGDARVRGAAMHRTKPSTAMQRQMLLRPGHHQSQKVRTVVWIMDAPHSLPPPPQPGCGRE